MSASDQLGSDTMRKMKDRLRSWRLSADTAANARGSKVIDGRVYDARAFRSPLIAHMFDAARVRPTRVRPICGMYETNSHM